MTWRSAPDQPATPTVPAVCALRWLYIIRTVNMRVPQTVVKLINVHTRGHIHPECEADRMDAPVFEEFDPASDCVCPGCAHLRRAAPRPLPARCGGRPAVRGVMVVAAAASAALGAV